LPCNSLEAETDLLIKKNHAVAGSGTPFKVAEKKTLWTYNTGSRDSGADPDLGKLLMFASGLKPTYHEQN
jgi:hypothetical protein